MRTAISLGLVALLLVLSEPLQATVFIVEGNGTDVAIAPDSRATFGMRGGFSEDAQKIYTINHKIVFVCAGFLQLNFRNEGTPWTPSDSLRSAVAADGMPKSQAGLHQIAHKWATTAISTFNGLLMSPSLPPHKTKIQEAAFVTTDAKGHVIVTTTEIYLVPATESTEEIFGEKVPQLLEKTVDYDLTKHKDTISVWGGSGKATLTALVSGKVTPSKKPSDVETLAWLRNSGFTSEILDKRAASWVDFAIRYSDAGIGGDLQEVHLNSAGARWISPNGNDPDIALEIPATVSKGRTISTGGSSR